MTSRLYVGNLAYSTTDEGLREFFAAAGGVKSAEVVIERSSSRSKGFGFVEMENEEGANNAMAQLNGKMLDQRPIRIDFAKPKEDRPERGNGSSGGYSREGGDRPQRSFSSGGGGGSYGGGGGGGGGGRGSRGDSRGDNRGDRGRDHRNGGAEDE